MLPRFIDLGPVQFKSDKVLLDCVFKRLFSPSHFGFLQKELTIKISVLFCFSSHSTDAA